MFGEDMRSGGELHASIQGGEAGVGVGVGVSGEVTNMLQLLRLLRLLRLLKLGRHYEG